MRVPSGRVVLVCVLVVVLGAFQLVRGAGLLPGITGCTSESGTMGFCKTTDT
ncbi:hypothetical protein [Actinophytocola sp.]|uniref:hypothetical protein n=1 Tax=Actinophytocola sp. TaxID=1872138 RepID=UPI0025BC8B01|nr:hypothetical protein [Actinophytocola sp.]